MAENAEPPVRRIVEAVAQAEDVDPGSLDPPLGTVVDADALGVLLESEPSDLAVRFTYCGHDVAVDESGRVQVN